MPYRKVGYLEQCWYVLRFMAKDTRKKVRKCLRNRRGRAPTRDAPRLTNGQYCEEHRKEMNRQYNKYERAPDVHRKYGRAWKRIRDRYAQEHPFCEMCFKEGRMTLMEEVHHIVPISRGGTHDRSNLMSLCRSCHNKIHIEMGDRHPHE